MAVDASQQPALNDDSLSSDDLFQSFMDIANTYSVSTEVENSSDFQFRDSIQEKAIQHLRETVDFNESEGLRETLSESVEGDSGHSDGLEPTNSKVVECTCPGSGTYSAVIDHEPNVADQNLCDPFVEPCEVEGEDISSVEIGLSEPQQPQVQESDREGSKNASELVQHTESVTTDKILSKFEDNNLISSLIQEQNDMDITVDGVKFVWHPEQGASQNFSELSVAEGDGNCQCKTHESDPPDLVCSCTKICRSKTDIESDTSSIDRVTESIATPEEGESKGLIRELYYDSPRDSAVYNDHNIQKCLDIIQERLETTPDVLDINTDTEGKSSVFYYNIDLGSSSGDEKGKLSQSSAKTEEEKYGVGDRKLSQGSAASKSESAGSKSSESDSESSDISSPKEKHGPTVRRSASSQSEHTQHQYAKQYRSHSDADQNPLVFSGYLIKLGGSGLKPKTWRRRWFELKRDNCLYYYKTHRDRSPTGTVILANYLVTRGKEMGKNNCFKLTKGGAKTYCLAADTEHDMKRWMGVISEATKLNEDTFSHIPQFSVKNVSIPALSIKNPDCHGYLWKQGLTHKSWKRRYCVLKSGCLYYYEDMSEPVAIGMFKMHGYDITETEIPGRRWSIIGIPPDPRMRSFYFSAENELDFNRWYSSFHESIRNVRAASLPR